MISTKIHGYLDYIMGVGLIALPLILNIAYGTASTILVILGAFIIVYSLITDYELGLLKILGMKTHLILDIAGGIFLAVSPWLLGFSEEIFWPFVVLGVLEVMVGLFTSKKPPFEANPAHQRNSI